jgi:hypothetical protein
MHWRLGPHQFSGSLFTPIGCEVGDVDVEPFHLEIERGSSPREKPLHLLLHLALSRLGDMFTDWVMVSKVGHSIHERRRSPSIPALPLGTNDLA